MIVKKCHAKLYYKRKQKMSEGSQLKRQRENENDTKLKEPKGCRRGFFGSLQLKSFNLFLSISMDFFRVLCFVFRFERLPKMLSGESLNLSQMVATIL